MPENKQTLQSSAWAGFLLKNRLKIIFLILASFAVYLNTLGNGFVSDDRDIPLDYKNQSYFGKIFTLQASYRTPEIFHYLDSLGGFNPWRYHLTNIFLHTFATLLIFYFLGQLLPKRLAFFSSLLFAIHPIHTDAVSWVVARSYILFTIFILLSLLLYLRATRENRLRKTAFLLSLLFYTLAFDARWAEPVFFPILLLVYNLSFRKFREKWKSTLPYFLVAGLFPLLMFGIIKNRVADTTISPATGRLDLNNVLINIPIAIFTYLKLFVLPLDLTFYHEDLGNNPFIYLLSLLTAMAAAGGLVIFYRRNKTLFFFLSLFILSLVHTFSPLKITWVIAERYVYLGSIGLVVIFTYSFLYLGKKPWLKTALFIIFLNLLGLYSLRTIIRNFDWKNEDSLWLATIKTSPTSSKALNNIGDYYGRQGNPQKAFESFVQATKINPTYADAWHNAGNVLLQNGRPDESIPYFEKSLQFNPNLVEAYTKLAWIYHKKGDQEKAGTMIKEALRIRPNDPNTYNLLASIEYENHNGEAAIEAIRKGLLVDPGNPQLQKNLQLLESLR